METLNVKHTYRTAERFILSREFFGMKLGLNNITEFLESIGKPQRRFRTVHVAGTNGKGSTSAMLESILRTSGYRTGLYTSPHLVDFRERIQVGGRKIPKRSVISFIDRHRSELVKKNSPFLKQSQLWRSIISPVLA